MKLLIAALSFPGMLAAAAPVPVDEAGYTKLLSSQRGKVVLVNFWATWCAPCRAEMPDLLALDGRLRAKGFQLVLVSADEPEQADLARKFLEEKKAGAPSYIKRVADDDGFIRKVDPKWSGAVPALFLYDRSGRLVRSFVGETDLGTVEAAIRKIL